MLRYRVGYCSLYDVRYVISGVGEGKIDCRMFKRAESPKNSMKSSSGLAD